MNNLLKPIEYAQKFGISRQAVYAKIKKGTLEAKNVEGKLYIVMNKEVNETKETVVEEKEVTPKIDTTTSLEPIISKKSSKPKKYKALLKAKDETIDVLKGTVKELKKSNKQVSSTLQSEIGLLKEAFHEMRTIYVAKIEHKKEEIIETKEIKIEKWIGVKKFLKQHNITQKKQADKIIKRLKKAHKKGDKRVIKRKNRLKFNANKKYKDILKK